MSGVYTITASLGWSRSHDGSRFLVPDSRNALLYGKAALGSWGVPVSDLVYLQTLPLESLPLVLARGMRYSLLPGYTGNDVSDEHLSVLFDDVVVPYLSARMAQGS